MTIWMLLAAMTGLAVMAVLYPLSRHRTVVEPADPNAQFYRDQIAEIDRDRERGLLTDAEAEAARAEAARRLLRANAVCQDAMAPMGEPALRRRRAVSALALSLVPIMALAVYGAYGSPQLAGLAQLQTARVQPGSDQLDLATALSRIETHLAKEPEDGRGWDVIAPVYLRMGRVDDAVKAYEAALRLLGPEANRLTSYGEAQVFVQGGIVSADARAAFEKALALDPSSPKARFYLARAAEQDGDAARARSGYQSLLASAPADAPWRPVVEEQLARLDGSAVPAGAGREQVVGMVEGLAARLDTQGGTGDEWARLVRSYMVLGEPEKAQTALKKARRALEQDQDGLRSIDAMARELKLTASNP
jgi:cytochrome c-type biogenesis protein CcmH